jgi:MFS family permease
MKRVIAAALLAQAALFILIGQARSVAVMAAVFLLLGLANNALDVSIMSLYFKAESAHDPNRKYGIYNFWMAAGSAAGLFVGGILTFLSSYRTLLAVFAGLVAVSLFAVTGLGEEKFSVVRAREYRSGILRPKTLAFAVLLFFLASHWGVEGTVYGPFLRSRFGLNDFQLALYMSIAYLGIAFSGFAVSRLKFNAARNRRLFLAGMALSGLGLILMVQGDVRLSFLFRVVHECGDGIMGALALLFIAGLFEKRMIGGSAGFLMAVQTSGQIAGSLAFATLGFRAGLQYPFYVAGAVLVANAVFGLYAVPKGALSGRENPRLAEGPP